MENDLYQVISVLHRGDKTCVDVDGLFEPRYRYCYSKRTVPYYFWFWINAQGSKEVPVSALGWGLCTWFAALLVRVPLSIGASDLIETCAPIGRRSGFEWDSSGIRNWCHILFSTLHIDGLR